MKASDLKRLVVSRVLVGVMGGAIVLGGVASGARGESEVAKPLAQNVTPGDRFGWSVSISGDTAVIGAYMDDDAGHNAGAAYILQRDYGGTDNWGLVVRFTASDTEAYDGFGISVSISGDTAVIGASGDDDGGSNSGSAYVYQRDHGGADNWGQVAKLTASDAAAGDSFGIDVSISGDTVVIGAFGDDGVASNSGSAYVFRRDEGGTDNWGQVAKLTASDAAASDYFGLYVSISGDTAVVGAYGDDDAGSESGSAYIFQRDEGGTDNWGQVTKLTASDGAADDFFGSAVSISGDTIVIGAYWDDDVGLDSGSAYIFERDHGGTDNWGQVTKLTASDGAADDWFGYFVSISADTVVIGANYDDDEGGNSGSAYVFQRDYGGTDNWGQVAKLTASDGAADDFFGSVSISGDTVLVGAPGDPWLTRSGDAYIFQRDEGGTDNWGELAKLITLEGEADDYFGCSVSISGDTAVIAARGNDDAGNNSGSAYVCRQHNGGTNNWGQVAKLTASDASSGDEFGYTVSISGDTVVIGAPGHEYAGGQTGAAYVFQCDEGGLSMWDQVTRLTASDAAAADYFGHSVSVSGDTVVIGAYSDDDAGLSSGSAYIFERDQDGPNNWGEVTKLTASDGAWGDFFGWSVSISGDTVVIGAYHDDDAGSDSGSAYIFERDQGGPNNWGQVAKLTASDAAPDDWFGSSVSISGDTAVVGAWGDDDGGSLTGSAYVFERDQGGADNWGQVAKLTASDAAPDDWFGFSVSISGDTVLVGNSGDLWLNNSGSAYIFERDQGGTGNWGQLTKLTASDAAAGDHFGWSVSISGSTAVIGAHYDDDAGSNSGSAYVFDLRYALTLLYKNGHMGRVVLDPLPDNPDDPRYSFGTDVTLTAEPNEGKQFTKWKVWDAYDANITVIDTNNPITIDMVADRQVKAFFKCGGGGAEQALPLLVVLGTLRLFALIRRRS